MQFLDGEEASHAGRAAVTRGQLHRGARRKWGSGRAIYPGELASGQICSAPSAKMTAVRSEDSSCILCARTSCVTYPPGRRARKQTRVSANTRNCCDVILFGRERMRSRRGSATNGVVALTAGASAGLRRSAAPADLCRESCPTDVDFGEAPAGSVHRQRVDFGGLGCGFRCGSGTRNQRVARIIPWTLVNKLIVSHSIIFSNSPLTKVPADSRRGVCKIARNNGMT